VSSRLDELVRATPATRDRYVDFLRAASIVAVVFGHWFISINHLERDIFSTTSAVGLTSGMWLGTWLFQVMPVFFFVGGYSNLVTYDAFQRRGEPTSAFVRSRLERLLRPSLVFLGFWLIVQVALHLFGVGGAAGPRLVGETRLLRGMYPPAATLPFGPLWFLGFYLVVVCIAPATIWLHRITPVRLIPTTRSHSSSVTSSLGPAEATPALLTRMSMRPKRATRSSTMAWTWSARRTSTG